MVGDSLLVNDNNDDGREFVPDGWGVSTLAEICNNVRGSVDPSQLVESIRYVGLEHLESGYPKLLNWGSSENIKSSKYKFQTNDILYGKLRPYLRKAVLADFEGVCSTELLVLKAVENYSIPEWVIFLLHTDSFVKHAIRTTGGTNLPRTSWKAIKEFQLSFPPLPEQKNIAYMLGTIQEAIEVQERIINAARELKRSLMYRLFTYGPYEEECPTKETEIGKIPKHWEILTLEQVMRDGIRNGAFIKREQFGSGMPFLNVADTYRNTIVRSEVLERVQYRNDDLEKYKLESGDLIFVRSSLKREGVGQCIVVDELNTTVIFDCHLMRVKPDKSMVQPKFLAYYFLSPPGRKSLIVRSKTTTMTTINQAGLASALVPVPSLNEQKAVAGAIETVEAKINFEESRKNALTRLFKSMLHQLMTGQVRVNGLEFKEYE